MYNHFLFKVCLKKWRLKPITEGFLVTIILEEMCFVLKISLVSFTVNINMLRL